MTEHAVETGSVPGRRKAKTEAPDSPLTLTYSLAELPSAQHRAGLAGLKLMVDWLRRQGEVRGVCEIVSCNNQGLSLRIDREGLAQLFDEVYAARQEEQRVNQLRKDKSKNVVSPIREADVPVLDKQGQPVVDRSGQPKTKKAYYYPAIVPKAALLVDLEPGKRKDGLWVKLWRNMVWNILRGVPATRAAFEDRANGQATKDAAETFEDLSRGPMHSVALPSTYFLGAQQSTAENVTWKDRARYQFLLHFWPFVAQIYVPRVLVDAKKDEKRFIGYAIAIPDVGMLELFCKAWKRMMQARTEEPLGYRPKQAVIDLALESALDMTKRIGEQLSDEEARKITASVVLGIEVFHMNKEGNNVRLLSVDRLCPEAAHIDEYARIRSACWDHVFRRQRLLNLVKQRPWFAGFDALAATLPYKTQFFGSSLFRHDAATLFAQKRKKMSQTEPSPNPVNELTASRDWIASLVYRIARGYVHRKVKSKYGLEWKSEWMKWEKLPPAEQRARKEFIEKQEKVASDAFLAVRGRTGTDFLEYFGGTLCSVPQAISGADFRRLEEKFKSEEGRNEVRVLTLIALSAAAYTGVESQAEAGPTEDDSSDAQ